MRTAIFILALAVHDVAVALGSSPLSDQSWSIYIWVVAFFIAFDIMDVFKYKKS